MNRVFIALSMSKQSFHQRLNRNLKLMEYNAQLILLVKKVRVDHPRMSSRQMYRLLKPSYLGRDRFEILCFENGFKVTTRRAYHRTTNSLGVTRFEDLATDFVLSNINQLWASDITYYRIGNTFYYLTFILDLYSKLIVGYSVSLDLQTECTTIAALQAATKMRRRIPSNLIIHSDGGGQYYSKQWLELTRKYKMRNSMCESPYENPQAERLNGIIKNDYIVGYGPEDFNQLITMTGKAVTMYNKEKPHGSIGNISPTEFERRLKTNPTTVIHKVKKRKKVAKKEKTYECG